ncbi:MULTISPECIES: conserved phage C-terminal domain-containing protein [Cytobacillus]|uniref:conserved phage C-terminal domain-containing protein n=1 Tax=Cytobacillus TaxID=2675230 RepID=UPI00064ED09D|nr:MULTISPECIES: conserved phage C-terminal domain-containing protein [Cytobacillus]KML41742.1 replication protein [Cytobacillus firmus]MCC3649105.1 conserved phage C-terminal domain-containing protein [Cytobacillus oceanisediminis]MCS0655447.1 conserved phage C-terminal domain-containing protein [Cytobacillus firmus]
MSSLLVDERPMLILPSLAEKVGLNEAVLIQQIHYWLVKSRHVKEGRKWIYNTYKDWKKQMPFWSHATIGRTIRSLEEMGFLMSANFNASKMDKTKWYTIDYEKIAELEATLGIEHRVSQVEEMTITDCNPLDDNEQQPIPEITTETTTEKKDIPYAEVIEYLNSQTHTAYRTSSKKTKKLIRARWQEGFSLEDFKKVIDLKAEEWLHDPYWRKFLRPETLFGTRFESYLNQKPLGKQLREEDFNFDD